MTQMENRGLFLNIVPVSFSSTTIPIGTIDYINEDAYSRLRDENWQTHAFRYDSTEKVIHNISLKEDVQALGTIKEAELSEHLLLVGRAVQRSILVWLAGTLTLPIIRAGKKLIFWGQAQSSQLLTKAITKHGWMPTPGLEATIKYEVDCRLFTDSKALPFLGLVIDVGASNIIDISVKDLMAQGISPVGRYVCRRREPDVSYLRPGLELLGRVTEVNGNTLLLTDTETITEIDATGALLEPRQEVFEAVINSIYGEKASALLSTLRTLRQPMITANGKLSQLRATLSGLKKRDFFIGNGVRISFGDILHETNTRFPSKVSTSRPGFLVGPQGRNTHPYPDFGITEYGPYMYTQHTRNAPVIGIVCEAASRGRMEQFLKSLEEGYPEVAWTNTKTKNPFRGGLVGKFQLTRIRFEYEECEDATPENYKRAIQRLLTRLSAPPDLAIVQIRERFRDLRGEDNPYFVAKTEFMRASGL